MYSAHSRKYYTQALQSIMAIAIDNVLSRNRSLSATLGAEYTNPTVTIVNTMIMLAILNVIEASKTSVFVIIMKAQVSFSETCPVGMGRFFEFE